MTIEQAYPVNIEEEDKPIFDVALKHTILSPVISQSYGKWLHPFSGAAINGFKSKLFTGVKILVGRNKFIQIEKGALVTNCYSKNYFHWINDVLPGIIYMQEAFKEVPVIIPEDMLAIGFINESLKILDVPVLPVSEKEVCFVKELFVPQLGGAGAQDIFYFQKLQKRLLKGYGRPIRKRKVFISRKGEQTRNIESFEAIAGILIKNGFEIVQAETLTFTEQIILFSETSHLIGVHGAGLTNMIFMEPGSRIMEIRRKDDMLNYCYYFMAHSVQLAYYYFLADGVIKNAEVQNDNFIVVADEFRKTLDGFLSS